MIPSGLISMSSGLISCCKIAACSGVKGVEDRPWKERVQSTCFSFSPSTGGGSERPSVRERRGVGSGERSFVWMGSGGAGALEAALWRVVAVEGAACCHRLLRSEKWRVWYDRISCRRRLYRAGLHD